WRWWSAGRSATSSTGCAKGRSWISCCSITGAGPGRLSTSPTAPSPSGSPCSSMTACSAAGSAPKRCVFSNLCRPPSGGLLAPADRGKKLPLDQGRFRPMRRTSILVAALAVGLPLVVGGCSNIKQTLGLSKQSPDEFKVVSRAPLSMPPDYNLKPPTPGAPRPQEGTPRDQAKAAVFNTPDAAIADKVPPAIGEGSEGAAQSAGESALLQSAGISGVNPNIRKLVDAETDQDQADSVSLADELTFWRDPQPYGTVIDPA